MDCAVNGEPDDSRDEYCYRHAAHPGAGPTPSKCHEHAHDDSYHVREIEPRREEFRVRQLEA